MNLKEKILADLKIAMQAKNELEVSVLRMLLSAIRNKEISLRSGEDVSLSDEQTQEVISSEIKKRKDSVSSYQEASRKDLADKEESELKILEKYLPEQLSDDELKLIVGKVVSESDDNNFGKIMGQVMGLVKGKADGNRVSQAVKDLLQ